MRHLGIFLAVSIFALAGMRAAAAQSESAPSESADTSEVAGPPVTEAERLFVRRVAPLLKEKCVACHGQNDAEIEGGLDLRTHEAVLAGGDSGEPALVPNEPEVSPLYLAALRTDAGWSAMPPKEAEGLTEEQTGWLHDWIAGGAPWPDAARAKEIAAANADRWSVEDGIEVPTKGALSPEWAHRKYKPEALWAYQPVTKPEVPVANASSPIDAFLLVKLPPGLPVAPPAERATLLRRVTFDLTGLPPSPEELADFLQDARPDDIAFAAVVERLLASPHYGERMAEHWLDVARYADSSGFANDYQRGGAWRYRDYVVRAFNDDQPYWQFVAEQIAGDELRPDDPEAIVATGFLRMGPWELTGMEVAKVARQRFLDDVTNSVGETFLAHALQCARCHDHKFDPIPTHDYYSVQAVFATTQLAERKAEFLPHENTAGFEERKYLEQLREQHQRTLKELNLKLLENAQVWYQEQGLDPAPWNDALAKVGENFNAARNHLRKEGLAEDAYPPKLVGFTPEEFGRERVARKGLERLRWEIDRYEPYALAVYSGLTPQLKSVTAPQRIPEKRLTQGEREQTAILTGGDPFSPGTPVEPGILSVLDEVEHPSIPTDIEGRRGAFAQWVANPENPLTTRTIVNRVWQWSFGRGIAGNANNFGGTGARPTHPELLDYLAASFVEDGGSIKSLHRRILNTAAYRRSAAHPDVAKLEELDPLGTSYAAFRPRRLSASEIRDAQLAVSGELNRTLGGIPNRPEMNLEAALQPRQVMGTFAEAWTPNPLPEQRHRRSLYALKIRGLPDPLLEVFNAPSPDFSCERRDVSTVTPQVFALFNGEATYARALALAHRVTEEGRSGEEAIDRIFQLAYSRGATDQERKLCLEHWQTMRDVQAQREIPEFTRPTKVTREAVEENTGERFTFEEPLYAYEDFVPDRQPADATAETRALADVCLAILNSNEFVYLY